MDAGRKPAMDAGRKPAMDAGRSMRRIVDMAPLSRSGVPEDATVEPPILTPDQIADRATLRAERQEHDRRDEWPQPDDPLRQPGEMSPAPDKRR
jgi:hypothetical protein